MCALIERINRSAELRSGLPVAWLTSLAITRALRSSMTQCPRKFRKPPRPGASLNNRHIRKASQGVVALENCHPFSRSWGGQTWVLAHDSDPQLPFPWVVGTAPMAAPTAKPPSVGSLRSWIEPAWSLRIPALCLSSCTTPLRPLLPNATKAWHFNAKQELSNCHQPSTSRLEISTRLLLRLRYGKKMPAALLAQVRHGRAARAALQVAIMLV